MPSPALPGLFFCAAACVLLIIATVSVPIWDDVYFLEVRNGAGVGAGQRVRFGTFGFTGSETKLGYTIPPEILGEENTSAARGTLRTLTFIMVLHPIAAAFAGLSVLFGLCGLAWSRVGTIFMTLSAALATLVTLIVFVIDMVLWGIAKGKINRDTSFDAKWGNANWMVLGAFVSLMLGSCTGLFGACGNFRRRRAERNTVRV